MAKPQVVTANQPYKTANITGNTIQPWYGATPSTAPNPWGGYVGTSSMPNITWQQTTSGATYSSAAAVLSS